MEDKVVVNSLFSDKKAANDGESGVNAGFVAYG